MASWLETWVCTGGAIYNDISIVGAGPVLEQVTIGGNHANDRGGAIWNNTTVGPVLQHCILWGNSAPVDPEITGDPIDAASAYNTIQGGHPAGSNTSTQDPSFVRSPDSGDGNWATAFDNDYGNLRLSAGSPAVNAGDTNLISAGLVEDLARNPRVDGTSVDLGAYEGGFDTFAARYPHLAPEVDSNQDGAANVLPYLYGLDPEGAPTWDSKPRLVREDDRLYLEFVVRVTAGDYRLAMESSEGLPDWLPLPENLGNALVVDEVQDMPDGIRWQRVRWRVDPEDLQGYIHSSALLREP